MGGRRFEAVFNRPKQGPIFSFNQHWFQCFRMWGKGTSIIAAQNCSGPQFQLMRPCPGKSVPLYDLESMGGCAKRIVWTFTDLQSSLQSGKVIVRNNTVGKVLDIGSFNNANPERQNCWSSRDLLIFSLLETMQKKFIIFSSFWSILLLSPSLVLPVTHWTTNMILLTRRRTMHKPNCFSKVDRRSCHSH